MRISFQSVLDRAGSSTAIAEIFDVTQGAVSHWKAQGHIPESRYYEALIKLPDLAAQDPNAHPQQQGGNP